MITFPTTPETFAAYQENKLLRKLDDFERKLSDIVVELANISYQDGIDGEENTITIATVKNFFRLQGKELNTKSLAMWKSICWWCNEAYKQGKEAAQHE